MKKFFLCLLIVALLVSLTACKENQKQPDGTKNTNASQNTTTENKETENTKNTEYQPNTATEATENDSTLNTESQQNPATEATDSGPGIYDPYPIQEVTDDRITTTENQKIYNGNFFTITFPSEWKCLQRQDEDGGDLYFQDPALGDKYALTIRTTGAIYAYYRTWDQYMEYFSNFHEDVAIDSLTEVTIQGFKCTKVVYSYTEDNTKFVRVWYDNLIEHIRLYDFRVTYPESEKETYEPIFSAIMDSIRFKWSVDTDISTRPLNEAYAYAVKQYEENPQHHRDICKLQPETTQIVEIDGKYYQSYVASNVDHRYIWISRSEFPEESYAKTATWDWYVVGTANVYSLELLGKIDLGRR